MAKSKWETHVKDRLIEAWVRDELIDKQIAHKVGVAYSTFREYEKKYEELPAALKKK